MNEREISPGLADAFKEASASLAPRRVWNSKAEFALKVLNEMTQGTDTEKPIVMEIRRAALSLIKSYLDD